MLLKSALLVGKIRERNRRVFPDDGNNANNSILDFRPEMRLKWLIAGNDRGL